jgi:hypothetical protein
VNPRLPVDLVPGHLGQGLLVILLRLRSRQFSSVSDRSRGSYAPDVPRLCR